MVLWQEEAYTRKDEHGQPVSFVGSTWATLPSQYLPNTYQEDYKRRKRGGGGRFQFMTRSDLQLYSITGYTASLLPSLHLHSRV